MSMQVTKVWWDGDKLMAEPISEFDVYKPEPKRPQNCGTGYCSCIECVMEPAQPEQEPVAWRAWFDADNGARWLFSLWPEEERLDVEWQPLYTSPPAQPQQEPVAQQAAGYVAVCEVLEQVGIGALSRAPSKLQIEEMCNAVRTLYTTPPQRKPLTDEQIESLWDHGMYVHCSGITALRAITRAIEAAHGIGEKK